MTSDDVTYIQLVRGDSASARPRHGLTDDQKTGKACIQCGRPDARTHLGYVDGVSVKIHTQCVERWRNGDLAPGQ